MKRKYQGGGQLPMGMMPMGNTGMQIPPEQGQLQEVEGGGTHEENPLGGVPVGPNASVEEGETMVDDPEGKYVFSDRLVVTEEIAEKHGLPKATVGQTFAEASELLIDEERPNDPIAQRGNEEMKERLKNAQEEKREGMVGQAKDFISTQTPEDMAMMAPEDQEMFKYGGYYITDKKAFGGIAKDLDMPESHLIQMCRGGRIKMQGGGLLPTGTGMMDVSQFLDPNLIGDITKLPMINTPGLDAISPTEDANVPLDNINLGALGSSAARSGNIQGAGAGIQSTQGSTDTGDGAGYGIPEMSGWNKVMRYAPVAANAFQIAKATEPIDRLEGRDYYIPESLDRPRYDAAPEIAGLRAMAGSTARDIQSNAGGSGAAASANLLANNRNLRGGMSEAYDRKQRTDLNTDLAVQQQEQGARQYNRGMDYQADLANQQAQAMKDQMLTTGVNAAGENLGAIGKEGYQRDLIRRMFPYGPEGEYYGDRGEFNKQMRQNMMSQWYQSLFKNQ